MHKAKYRFDQSLTYVAYVSAVSVHDYPSVGTPFRLLRATLATQYVLDKAKKLAPSDIPVATIWLDPSDDEHAAFIRESGIVKRGDHYSAPPVDSVYLRVRFAEPEGETSHQSLQHFESMPAGDLPELSLATRASTPTSLEFAPDGVIRHAKKRLDLTKQQVLILGELNKHYPHPVSLEVLRYVVPSWKAASSELLQRVRQAMTSLRKRLPKRLSIEFQDGDAGWRLVVKDGC
jgi:hypothetical protein